MFCDELLQLRRSQEHHHRVIIERKSTWKPVTQIFPHRWIVTVKNLHAAIYPEPCNITALGFFRFISPIRPCAASGPGRPTDLRVSIISTEEIFSRPKLRDGFDSTTGGRPQIPLRNAMRKRKCDTLRSEFGSDLGPVRFHVGMHFVFVKIKRKSALEFED